ncbi:hypothetical protein DPMN_007101 [Dreissena polymorpha]|uniref:Uncharacterized protein n=1 Tax=Dreissena polymorpha TaxID=45954 RepID=A0A9D4MWF6_DREPO|nr:hypothetical protein DPMN_007101 [Dreissena polymorpha]
MWRITNFTNYADDNNNARVVFVHLQLSDTTPLARSGNPGYVIGKPIRYGTLNETTGLDGAKKYPLNT